MVGVSDLNLVVSGWRRYGKDRLYFARADGSKTGWWDVLAEEGHPESPADLEALKAAVAHWQSTSAGAVADGAAVVTATDRSLTGPSAQSDDNLRVVDNETPAPGPAPTWVDLAGNEAGAEARERAIAARGGQRRSGLDLLPFSGFAQMSARGASGPTAKNGVAAQLDKVARKDPRWRFLHAIPVGDRGSDISASERPRGVFCPGRL